MRPHALGSPTMAEQPTLAGRGLTLGPARPEDVAAISAVFAEPEVDRWWPNPGAADVRAKCEGTQEDAVFFVIDVDGRAVGGIEYWEEDDPEFRHAGIDVFLTAALHG